MNEHICIRSPYRPESCPRGYATPERLGSTNCQLLGSVSFINSCIHSPFIQFLTHGTNFTEHMKNLEVNTWKIDTSEI